MSIKIEVSYGELLDKITILEIKFDRIADSAKHKNIERELAVLSDTWLSSGVDITAVAEERDQLKNINETLWDIEDAIRQLEARKSFNEEFIALARQVYQTNDQRSEVKRRVNDKLGSILVEEKSYQPY